MSTKIEWTEETWNPITGCTPVSEGCANCYARRMANRQRGRNGYPRVNPFAVTIHGNRLSPETYKRHPMRWRKPRSVFVCSMADLMHEDVCSITIQTIIDAMVLTPSHTYQILTKRPERLLDFAWPSNCWVGVTVELPKYLDRIDTLRRVKAPIRFVSFEPLLSTFPNLYALNHLESIDWAIVGAETGPGKRPMRPEWASQIQRSCEKERIPFFFKKDSNGSNILDGKTWTEMPSA